MRLTSRTLRFLFAFLFASSVAASEEGAFILRTFRFESFDESGPVVVSGTQSDRGIDALRVNAFRKSFVLAPTHLKKLRGLMVNGIQIFAGSVR